MHVVLIDDVVEKAAQVALLTGRGEVSADGNAVGGVVEEVVELTVEVCDLDPGQSVACVFLCYSKYGFL